MSCSNESAAEISSESDESSLLEEIFSFDLTDDLENPFPCATEAEGTAGKDRRRKSKRKFPHLTVILIEIPFSAFCKD